jgi:hypothetical protein
LRVKLRVSVNSVPSEADLFSCISDGNVLAIGNGRKYYSLACFDGDYS